MNRASMQLLQCPASRGSKPFISGLGPRFQLFFELSKSIVTHGDGHVATKPLKAGPAYGGTVEMALEFWLIHDC